MGPERDPRGMEALLAAAEASLESARRPGRYCAQVRKAGTRGGWEGRSDSRMMMPPRESEMEALEDLARLWAAGKEEEYPEGDLIRLWDPMDWPEHICRLSPEYPGMPEMIARERARLEAQSLGEAAPESAEKRPGRRL